MTCRALSSHALAAMIFLILLSAGDASPRSLKRVERAVPDIPGYLTLQCDLHVHTVFSDGLVWPTIRVQEAWREGLDALSITDHNEYTPHKDDLPKNPERPHELAAPAAEALGLLLIRGSEITKQLPVGHYNAIFLTDIAALDKDDYLEAVGAAVRQGAFVWWNHPPFQQKNAETYWHAPQSELLARGWMHGIEVANGPDYCPEAHAWCIEHNLTMMGNSDVHGAVFMEYDPYQGDRRTVTLVFSTERSEPGIREALFARRTAVLCSDTLYGVEEHLGPLFRASLELVNPEIKITGGGDALLQVRNLSDIPFYLAATDSLEDLAFPVRVTLEPRAVTLIRLSGKAGRPDGTRRIELPYAVTNVHPAPGVDLIAPLSALVNFKPEN